MPRPPLHGFESVGGLFLLAMNQSEYDQENDSNLLMNWSNLLSLPNQDWIKIMASHNLLPMKIFQNYNP